MKNETRYLKWILNLLTFLLIIGGIGGFMLLVSLVLNLTGLTDRLVSWLQSFNSDHFTVTTGNLQLMIWDNLAYLYNVVISMGLLVCLRKFLKNLIAEDIFVEQNVKLARLGSALLFIGSFMGTGSGLLTINSFALIDFTYIPVGAVLWIMSLILEKAIAIAEENEFTI